MKTSEEEAVSDKNEKAEEDASSKNDWFSFGSSWSTEWLKSAREKVFFFLFFSCNFILL